MTMTPPASVAPDARRPGARTHRLASTSRIVAAAAAVLLGVSVFAGAFGAAPSAVAADGETSSGLELLVAAEGDGVVGDDGSLRVALSMVNQTATTVPAGTADIFVGRAPLASRSAVSAWLEGTRTTRLRDVGTATLGAVSSLSAVTATTVVEVGDDLDPGVYALRATSPSPRGTLVSRGVFVVGDEVDGDIAVLVPITAGPLENGLLSSDELAELTAPGGGLRAQVDAVTGTAAILAVDPAVVAAIRVLGTTAPPTATEWLDDLLALPNTRFALQFGDADLAAQYAAGVTEPLTVPTLAPAIVAAGVDTSTPSPTPTPTPTPTPGSESPVTADMAALTDIGDARGDVFWPAEGTVDADLVASLGSLSPEAVTIVSSADVGGEAGARARAGDSDLLVYDADVSAALRTATSAPRRIDRTAALATASAYASFADADADLLVTVGRSDDRTLPALRAAVRAAVRLDNRDAVSLTAVHTGTAEAVTVGRGAPDADRVAAVERFLDDEKDLAEFATILADPTVLTATERAAVLQLLGNGWVGHPDAWRVAVEDHLDETAATLDAVAIVPSPDINLLGSSAPLTFSVRNDLPWPATLVLLAEPNDPRLVVQNRIEVAAGAAQTTRVDVPVQARVGSGESSLDLELRSPTMVPIGTTTTVVVSVQAEWESVGIAVMAVLVGTFLVLGIVRTVLRLRRRAAPRSDGRADG